MSVLLGLDGLAHIWNDILYSRCLMLKDAYTSLAKAFCQQFYQHLEILSHVLLNTSTVQLGLKRVDLMWFRYEYIHKLRETHPQIIEHY